MLLIIISRARTAMRGSNTVIVDMWKPVSTRPPTLGYFFIGWLVGCSAAGQRLTFETHLSPLAIGWSGVFSLVCDHEPWSPVIMQLGIFPTIGLSVRRSSCVCTHRVVLVPFLLDALRRRCICCMCVGIGKIEGCKMVMRSFVVTATV